MREKTRIYGLGLIVAGLTLALTLTGCPNNNRETNQDVPLTGLTLDVTGTINLNHEASRTLTVTATPALADTDDSIVWVSDAEEYVSVTPAANGLTAVIEGLQLTGTTPVRITARSRLNSSVEAFVMVNVVAPVYLQSVEITNADAVPNPMTIGATFTLTIETDPPDANNIEWLSSDPSRVSVTQAGVITALAGTTDGEPVRITVRSDADATISDYVDVTVARAATNRNFTWWFNHEQPIAAWTDNFGETPVSEANPGERTDVAHVNNMTIFGSHTTNGIRFGSTATAGTRVEGSTVGRIQVSNLRRNATGATGEEPPYFLEIADVQGPFSLTVNYSDTGGSNGGRHVTFFVNGEAVTGDFYTPPTGLNQDSLVGRFNFRGTETVTVQVGLNQALRIYEVILSEDFAYIPEIVQVTGVTIDGAESFNLIVGSRRDLTARVQPDNASQAVTWASSNDEAATVSPAGMVVAVAVGTATITATSVSDDTRSASVTVTVVAPPEGHRAWLFNSATATAAGLTAGADGFFAIPAENADWGNGLTLIQGGITARAIRPEQASGGIVGAFQAAHGAAAAPEIARIEGITGMVAIEVSFSGTGGGDLDRFISIRLGEDGTPVRFPIYTIGTTLRTHTMPIQGNGSPIYLLQNNALRIYRIAVTPIDARPITGIAIEGIATGGTFNLQKEGTRTLVPAFTPADTTDIGVTWTSSAPAIATVGATGIVTAVSVGQANITVTSTANTTVNAAVTVNVTPIPVATVTINEGPVSIALTGERDRTFTATVLPANATNRTVTWASSNAAVASVVPATGVVTALTAGYTDIRATAGGETSTPVRVTVTTGEIAVTGVTITPAGPFDILVGDTITTFDVTVAPDTATGDLAPTWASSNTAVATIDAATGHLLAVGQGTTNITATVRGVTSAVPVVVNVTQPVTATWLFGYDQARWAGLVQNIPGTGEHADPASFFPVTSSVYWGNGLTIVEQHATNRNIRPFQVPADVPEGVIGSLQIGGTPLEFARIDGANGQVRIDIAFSNTGGSNTARWPSVRVGDGVPQRFYGNVDTVAPPNATNLSRDHVVVDVSGGAPIFLSVSAALRIFEIRITPIGTATFNPPNRPLTSISIAGTGVDAGNLTLEEGASARQLSVTFNPADHTNSGAITWSSSNANVAAVNERTGLVTPVAAGGPVTITATSPVTGVPAATVQVTVTLPPRVTGINFTGASVVPPNHEFTITAHVQPSNAYNRDVTWGTVVGATVITYDETSITLESAGSGTITVPATSVGRNAENQQVIATHTVTIDGGAPVHQLASVSVGATNNVATTSFGAGRLTVSGDGTWTNSPTANAGSPVDMHLVYLRTPIPAAHFRVNATFHPYYSSITASGNNSRIGLIILGRDPALYPVNRTPFYSMAYRNTTFQQTRVTRVAVDGALSSSQNNDNQGAVETQVLSMTRAAANAGVAHFIDGTAFGTTIGNAFFTDENGPEYVWIGVFASSAGIAASSAVLSNLEVIVGYGTPEAQTIVVDLSQQIITGTTPAP